MKKIILLYLLFNLSNTSFGQFPVSIDSVYTFIKYNSVFRNTVDWKKIDTTFINHINSARSLSDTMKCFVSVLESLNDVHSQLFLNNKYYGNYPVFDDTTLAWLKPLNDKSITATNKIYTKLFSKNIAYISVPSVQVYDNKQINEFAQTLSDSINKFSSKKIKGFIIDLRLNGGGNIYPMLSGLSSLLGDNVIGFETDIKDSIVRKWELKKGNFIIGTYQSTNIKQSYNPKLVKIPIVVLIGPITKSSGSMTAIAFKKRPRTIFIGEPTANGYTTSNGYFQFAPNLTTNFATNFVADRSKTTYKTTVNPDITVYHGDNFEDMMQDEKIKLAIQWLTKNNSRLHGLWQ